MAQIDSKAAAIQALIQTLAITASKLTTQVSKGETSASAEHEAVRLSLLQTLQDLKNILEDPKDRSLQIALQVNQNVAIRAAIYLNIFEALSQHDVGDGVDIDWLTKGVGEQRADIVLVSKFAHIEEPLKKRKLQLVDNVRCRQNGLCVCSWTQTWSKRSGSGSTVIQSCQPCTRCLPSKMPFNTGIQTNDFSF